MSQYNDTGYSTVVLSATVGQFLRVTPAGALGVLATVPYATTRVAGVSGDVVGVTLCSKQGTAQYVASKAIAVGAKVYTTTGGKVTDTFATGGFCLGVARSAATADNDVIEVAQMPSMVTGA